LIDVAYRISLNVTVGQRISARLLGHLDALERLRGFERVSAFLPPDPVVAFAGAHTGTVVMQALDQIPGSRVLAFECDPHIFPILVDNFRREPRLIPIQAALYSRGHQLLKLSTRDGLGSQSTLYKPSSLYGTTWPHIEWGSKVGVRTAALGPAAQRYGFGQIDFVYLDVECAELEALRGLRGLLPNVSVLHVEVSTVPLCEGGPLWPEVQRFLHTRGFRVVMMPEEPLPIRFDVTAVRNPARRHV